LWFKTHKVANIVLFNNGNTIIRVESLYLNSTPKGGESDVMYGEYIRDNFITLQPGESRNLELNIENIDVHRVAYIEVRYTSSIDNFERLFFWYDKKKKTIK
jgi:hypothetical protein